MTSNVQQIRKGRPTFASLEKAYAQGFIDGKASGAMDLMPTLEGYLRFGLSFSDIAQDMAEKIISTVKKAFETAIPPSYTGKPMCADDVLDWARNYIQRNETVRTFMHNAPSQ